MASYNKYRRIELYNKQKNQCYYCNRITRFDNFTVDHVIPKWQKGQDNMANLVGACKLCNTMKGGKEPGLFNLLVRKCFESHVDRLVRA